MKHSFILHRERIPHRFGMRYFKQPASGGEFKPVKYHEALAMVASGEAVWSSELKKKAKEATAQTCQICGRKIEYKRGWIAHHGYTRPSHGWQTSSCYGAKYKSYEESWLAIPGALQGCEEFKARQEEYLIELREKPPVSFSVIETRRERMGYGRREEYRVWYSIWRGHGSRPLPEYRARLKFEISETEQHIKEATRQIERFIGLIQKWKEVKQ